MKEYLKELTHKTPLIIKLHGYEYHLVEVQRPLGTPEARFMGHPNMALQRCNKIVAQPPTKKKK